VNKVPGSWETIALAELCERLVDGSHNPPPAVESGKPMLSARNINYFSVLFDEYRFISESAFEVENARTQVTPGDVLLTIVGTIGRAAVVAANHPPFALQRSVAVLKPRGISARYLAYALSSPEQQRWLTDNAKGTAQKGVYLKTLGTAEIHVAPLAEQTRIVAKLEELLSDLDAGVAELKAAQKKLAQYRQSLLKAAVEGALTAAWRAQHQPTETGAQLLQRILQERRARWEARQLAKFAEQGKTPPKDWQKKYPEPVQPDASGLPQLPQGWVWATIDQIAQVGTGVTPLRSKSAYFNEGTIPWVTSGALNSEAVASATELVTELALKECRLELYPVGSLLVAMYGEGKTRGKCSELRIPATINQAIAAIVLEPAAQSCKAYLKAFLLDSYEKMRAQASGGVQPNLNLQIVKAIALPLPPCSEQAEITQLLDGQFDQISQQQIAVQVSLQQSTAQRQNILRAAFSGQLVPQDPHDEPASVLLERIRAERAAQGAVKKPRGRKAKEAA